MLDAWRRDCALYSATPESASAYEIHLPQILEVIWLHRRAGQRPIRPGAVVVGTGADSRRASAIDAPDGAAGRATSPGTDAAGGGSTGSGDVQHHFDSGQRAQILGP